MCPYTDIPDISARKARALGGGDTCDAYHVVTSEGEELFVKQTTRFPGMLEAEAKGLRLMARVPGVPVPKVRLSSETSLVLEYLPPSSKGGGMQDLGRSLALLHRQKSDAYGLAFDNYIGQSPQKNLPLQSVDRSWADFFLDLRLCYQVELASGKGRDVRAIKLGLRRATALIKERLEACDDSNEGASLLHGDLWGGNICHGYFIDPAVYYGHRETDLAMTRLFGGFEKSFYQAYQESYPLLDSYSKREPIYQLYHILNHYTIFGGGYGRQAEIILEQLRTA
jgi:protein-ribulosamine 3-kinase